MSRAGQTHKQRHVHKKHTCRQLAHMASRELSLQTWCLALFHLASLWQARNDGSTQDVQDACLGHRVLPSSQSSPWVPTAHTVPPRCSTACQQGQQLQRNLQQLAPTLRHLHLPASE